MNMERIIHNKHIILQFLNIILKIETHTLSTFTIECLTSNLQSPQWPTQKSRDFSPRKFISPRKKNFAPETDFEGNEDPDVSESGNRVKKEKNGQQTGK